MNNNQHLDIVCFDLGPDEQSWHMLSVKEIAAEKLIPFLMLDHKFQTNILLKYFRSTDTERSELLRSCAACKVLTLKVGAPVILIRNISEGLYNGYIGQVANNLKGNNILISYVK
jgi:hypothetical protein